MEDQLQSHFREYKQCRSRLIEAHEGLRRLDRERNRLVRRARRKGVFRLAVSESTVVARLAEIQYVETSMKNMVDLLRVDAWLAREKCLAGGGEVPARHDLEGEGFEGVAHVELLKMQAELEDVVNTDIGWAKRAVSYE